MSSPGIPPHSLATHPFAGLDVTHLLTLRCETRGSHPFLTWAPFEGLPKTWTYGRFWRDVERTASALASRGVRLGDHVLVHLDNCPEFLLGWFACARLGAVAVTTNTRSSGDELRYFVEDCRPVGAITQPRYAELLNRTAPHLRWLVTTDHDGGVPAPMGTGPDHDSSFASLLEDRERILPRVADPLVPMCILYTSGSTARPKGIVWTHGNALWSARVSAAHEELTSDDVHLVYAPLFHSNALTCSVLPTLWAGSTMVLLPKWSTSRFWDISLQHHCTWLSIVGYAQSLFTMEAPRQHSYRLWGSGVCNMPSDERIGVKTIGWWGMTETITHGIVGCPSLPNRPMSIGRPAPEYQLAVVDEAGAPVGPEETGELLIKGVPGVSLFAGYLNQNDATQASFDEHGWLMTGDLVTPGTDGYIEFAGRVKDMMRVGGENVAAAEVERVIMTLPGVLEAAVVGKPDSSLDEVPVAYVTSSGEIEDAMLRAAVLDRCREELSAFKMPREVHLVGDLPRVTAGKIDKKELRKAAARDRAPDVDRSAETPEH